MSGKTPAQLEAEIAAQREELAATVDQLSAKLDVKSRTQQKAAHLKERATTDGGAPRPEVWGTAAALAGLVAIMVWWRRR